MAQLWCMHLEASNSWPWRKLPYRTLHRLGEERERERQRERERERERERDENREIGGN